MKTVTQSKSKDYSFTSQRQRQMFWIYAAVVAITSVYLLGSPIILLPLCGVFYGIYTLFFTLPEFDREHESSNARFQSAINRAVTRKEVPQEPRVSNLFNNRNTTSPANLNEPNLSNNLNGLR